MQITRLAIKNVRAIEDFQLDLALAPAKPRRRLVLLGVNGAGKTTILDAIVHAFQSLAESLDMGGVTLGAADVRNVEDPEIGSPTILRSGSVRLHAIVSEQERATSLFVLGAPAEGELSFLVGDPFDIGTDIDGDALVDEDVGALGDGQSPVASLEEPGGEKRPGDPGIADSDTDEGSIYRDAVAAALLRQDPPCLFLPADRGVLEDRDDVPIRGIKGGRCCSSSARSRCARRRRGWC